MLLRVTAHATMSANSLDELNWQQFILHLFISLNITQISKQGRRNTDKYDMK